MKFICIKYSGLKFNYIFESEKFMFLPDNFGEHICYHNVSFDQIKEVISCKYDESSKFYVLDKEQVDERLTLNDISEEKLFKFKILEAIIGMLFSNRIVEHSIIILQKQKDKYKILKIFKNFSTIELKRNITLLLDNYITTNILIELIDNIYSKLDLMDDPKDLCLKYNFCFDMYMKGKFSSDVLLTISYLWVSLEVLATITIRNVIGNKEPLFPETYKDQIKEKVREIVSSVIPKAEVKCWENLKKNYIDNIVNKIDNFLPIRKKIIEVTNEYIDKDDIYFYDDRLSIKKLINAFFDYRNALFHGGKLPKRSNYFERQKYYFCLLIERLFFKILNLKQITFQKRGDNLFLNLIENMETINIADYSQHIINFISNKYILQLKKFPINKEESFSQNTDLDQLVNNFYDKGKSYSYIIDDLNKEHEKINILLRKSLNLMLFDDKNVKIGEMDLVNINGRELSLYVNSELNNISQLWIGLLEHKQFLVKNKDNEDLLLNFKGFIEHVETINNSKTQIKIIITPECICFQIN